MDWLTWLIAVGVVVLLSGIVFVVFKYLTGKTAKSVIGFSGGVIEAIAGMLPDNADKLDAHDFIEA